MHYRKSPGQEATLKGHIAQCLAECPTAEVEVLLGKAMFEVKRIGVDKGSALRKLMKFKPFAGRNPVFIGDDVTDEAAFQALSEFGGQGFSVGRRFPETSGMFSAPRCSGCSGRFCQLSLNYYRTAALNIGAIKPLFRGFETEVKGVSISSRLEPGWNP